MFLVHFEGNVIASVQQIQFLQSCSVFEKMWCIIFLFSMCYIITSNAITYYVYPPLGVCNKMTAMNANIKILFVIGYAFMHVWTCLGSSTLGFHNTMGCSTQWVLHLLWRVCSVAAIMFVLIIPISSLVSGIQKIFCSSL